MGEVTKVLYSTAVLIAKQTKPIVFRRFRLADREAILEVSHAAAAC